MTIALCEHFNKRHFRLDNVDKGESTKIVGWIKVFGATSVSGAVAPAFDRGGPHVLRSAATHGTGPRLWCELQTFQCPRLNDAWLLPAK